ncbi:MAG: VWA domain-containing protein [Clostridia bacterium]|nr:VWA domain-containing protein [Clostridia bacterium]
MRKNLTEMVFILDKSGSMAGMEKDTVGGFNAMIEKQRREEGDALVSTVLFSNESRVIHDRADIAKVEPLTDRQYFVGGCTALYDAVGDAIHHIGNVHKYAREEDRPEKTVFVITTDGMENASRRYSAGEVKRLITRQKERYGWEFLFLGANIDARAVADDMGIEEERSACFVNDSRGNALKYEGISRAMSKVRKCMPVGADWKADMEEDCRKRQ